MTDAAVVAEQTSVLLTTHYIEEAERLASMIVIIDHGTVIASGTPAQLRDRAGGDRLDLQAPPARIPASWRGRLPRSARERPLSMRQRVGSSCPSPTWRPPCPPWLPGCPPP